MIDTNEAQHLPRITRQTVRLLKVLVSQPERDDWYGTALAQRSGFGQSTVATFLYRLQALGWVESRKETKEIAGVARRPARRFFKLTSSGLEQARAVLRNYGRR